MMFRTLTVLDAPFLACLHKKVIHPWEKAWSAKEFSDLLHQPSIHGISLWEEHHTVLHLKSFILYQHCDAVDILYIATHPSRRNKGYASHLMNHLTHKNLPIILDVCEKNEIAIKFYQKFGFQPLYTRKNYYIHNRNDYSAITFYLK